MKYEDRLKIQEYAIYGVIWTLVFMMPVVALWLNADENAPAASLGWMNIWRGWRQLLPFFLLFLIHHFLMVPILTKKQNRSGYFIGAFCLLTLFAVGQAIFNDHRPLRGPLSEMTERMPLPPNGFMPDEEHPEGSFGAPLARPDRKPDDEGHGAPSGFRPPEEGGPRLTQILIDNPAISYTFIAFLMFGMNLGINGYFRTMRERRDAEELRRQHLEQELEYLRYQINPHFFMNTLNNIHALVDIDPEQAKSTIVELSRLMRYVLYDGSRPTIPLTKETEFLQHYIALMRLRFSDHVRIEVDIPEDIPDVQVPPLLFISFVENAFKHGISYQSESFIMVSINVRGGFISFSCINSRHETNQDPHSGIGLENTQKRLKLLYQDNYTFNINKNQKTYEVLLKIPVTYD